MNSSHALVGRDHPFAAANCNTRDPWPRLARLEAALEAQEPVVGAAILAATAFRLRDEAGLIETLRCLANAVAAHEVSAARDEG